MQVIHEFFEISNSTERIVEVAQTEAPFTELILSWNGFRPAKGHWSFSAKLFQGHWSEWLPLAEWGLGKQKTFSCNPFGSFAKSYQDVAVAKRGHCTGYQIRIQAEMGATVSTLQSITVSIGDPSSIQIDSKSDLPSVQLTNIPAQSQQILAHPRAKDLCSPTSTTSAINFLQRTKSINPTQFAELARDQTFDIYGNWILNTAAAYEALEGRYQTYVSRLPNFKALHTQLCKGLPIVVSVKGPIAGAPLPYAHGHLIFVTGYDAISRRVHCMDPAYSTTEQTLTSYPLEEFLKAWTERRKNLAYIFDVYYTH